MLLEAKNLTKRFQSRHVIAVDDVSFALQKGETLGIVGESGSGKSTLAKLVLRLLSPDAGEIFFNGVSLSHLEGEGLRKFRKKAQIIFQHPAQSLDPRMKVAGILREPFLIHGLGEEALIRSRINEWLDRVELGERFLPRYPHELSGGECQRVAIARAMVLEPELLVCDEPVSALDWLVQAQLLNLLLRLQREKNSSLIFISHDLRVVRHMSDEILVMKEGRVCESAPRDRIFRDPAHPYTRALIQIAYQASSIL